MTSHEEATINNSEITIEGFGTFRHQLNSRVRSYDVDRLNIVHNAVYLYWLEAARIEYFRDIGIPIDRHSFVSKHRFVVAEANIHYLIPAQFDDSYTVHTRVTFIKKSSFGFDHIVVRQDGSTLTSARAILVHVNPATQKPESIPDSYRTLIREFEKNERIEESEPSTRS